MEDILTPLHDKTIKWSFVLFVVAAFLAVFFFAALENVPAGGNRTVPLVGGIICVAIALIFGILSFVRFLRKRSIVAGLFLTTTVSTLIYSIASRWAAESAAVPYAGAATPYAGTMNTALPITLAQVGLFAIWFLFILFTIYIYIRPIRRIDALLTQIIEGKEIKKLRVGKLVQYKIIEDKLRKLADEKHKRETQRKARLEKARAKGTTQKKLMQELLAEKEKLSPLPNTN